MRCYLLAVDIDDGFMVDGSEMEQDIATLPRLGNAERAFVPEHLVAAQLALNA